MTDFFTKAKGAWNDLMEVTDRLAAAKREAQDSCEHLKCEVSFDEEEAKRLGDAATTEEVRKRWPRFMGECPDCKSQLIKYASYAHYIYGDW